jgi:hypothetical protein
MSDWTRHCPIRGFCEVYLDFGVAQVGSDNVRLEVFVLWMTWKGLRVARLNYFHFIHHTPLNSMVFLYLRNIKITSST